jgi:hypothetical protein
MPAAVKPAAEETATDFALFAQDQWTVQRLTLNLGVRFNDSKAYTPEQVLPAGLFVPERRFEPVDDVPHYRNLSPRFGAAYDLFGTSRTALKASLGHYPDIIRGATANPVRNLVRSTNRTWNDANRDYVPNCDLHNPVANGECGPWSNLSFGQAAGAAAYSDDALSGFNSQFHNWQGSVSVQHQLRDGIGVNVGYFRTWYGGTCGGNGIPGAESCLLVTDNLRVAPEDYDPYCITAPTDSRLPNSGDQLCGLYDLRPALFGQTDNLVRPAADFGRERTRVYNGVDASINVRFGDGGVINGGAAFGRMVTDDCVVVDSPQDGRPDYCKVTPPWSAGTQLKVLMVYPLPWDIQTSAIYQNAPGIAILANQVVNNAAIAPSLGRNLSACRGAAVCNANVTIPIIPPQSMFEPRQQQLDLRFSRLFRLRGTHRLRGNLDVYNVFNASDVLAMGTTYGPSWQNVNSILTGRMLRVGAQWDF